MCFTCAGSCGRWWASSAVFLALTEQRRNRRPTVWSMGSMAMVSRSAHGSLDLAPCACIQRDAVELLNRGHPVSWCHLGCKDANRAGRACAVIGAVTVRDLVKVLLVVVLADCKHSSAICAVVRCFVLACEVVISSVLALYGVFPMSCALDVPLIASCLVASTVSQRAVPGVARRPRQAVVSSRLRREVMLGGGRRRHHARARWHHYSARLTALAC